MRRRIGIIGLGMAVPPHALSLAELADRVEVAGAFSPDKEHRARFAATYGFPVVDDISAILDDRSVTAVLILTPPATHLEVTRQAVAAGKHVLLEKPVEVTLARAEELVALCRRAGVTLGIVLQHRFRPGSVRLAQRLADGALGEIAAASVAIRWWRPQSYYDDPGRGTLARDGGGVLMTQAIHTLDLFQSLAGPIAEVTGFAGTTRLHRMETEDFCGAALRFANGALGTLDATTASYPGFPERIEIVGTKATAVLSGRLEIHYQDGRVETFEASQANGGGADPMAFSHEPHRDLIADFLDALDEGREPRVSGAEALAVHRLIDALLRSSRERRPVAIG
ncbi:MAG: Gfo/Idh/MocA family oxidoreductase [Rhodospirillales bacterium]|nr:Gfo/Idh/MocA family oxidoreductase [Rhodospirillales bacterium]